MRALIFFALYLSSGTGFVYSLPAQAQLSPSLDDFRRVCRERRKTAPYFTMATPEIGRLISVPTLTLMGNQGRFCFSNFVKKLNANDPGPIRGIFYAGRVYIVDGHHRALAATYKGLVEVQMIISEDLTAQLTPHQFEQYMADHSYSYFRDSDGNPTARVDLCEMLDDPLLNLARKLVTKKKLEYADGEYRIVRVKGQAVFFMVKSEGVRYLELYVADALRRARIEWDQERSQTLTPEETLQYSQIILQAIHQPGSKLGEILLLGPTAQRCAGTLVNL